LNGLTCALQLRRTKWSAPGKTPTGQLLMILIDSMHTIRINRVFRKRKGITSNERGTRWNNQLVQRGFSEGGCLNTYQF
jgi:hypothetical protein